MGKRKATSIDEKEREDEMKGKERKEKKRKGE